MMELVSLQNLVRSFVVNDVDYGAFRAAFVQQFLSVRHDDPAMENLVNDIESACADMDEGHISLSDLKNDLFIAAGAQVFGSISLETETESGPVRQQFPLSGVPRSSGSRAEFIHSVQPT